MKEKETLLHLNSIINKAAIEKNIKNLKILQNCSDLISKYLQGFNIDTEAKKLYIEINKHLNNEKCL